MLSVWISELFVSSEPPVEMLATGHVYLDISLIETDSGRHHGDTETKLNKLVQCCDNNKLDQSLLAFQYFITENLRYTNFAFLVKLGHFKH